jgi:lipopolysaccharide export system permease protein
MKTYKKFLISLFTISLIKVFFIFFGIVLLLNILEQSEFFKDADFTFFYIVFLSFLNAPSIMFEILPFIFLISTQVFFIELINKNELQIFKYQGLNNNKIVKIISMYSFALALIFVVFFYNMSSILKNSYLMIKNKHSNDGKYLAVINKNGLWIRDKINNQINIINANKIENNFLLNVSISQFNNQFEIINTMHSKKVDIASNNWKVINPIILKDNVAISKDLINFQSNFDLKKINSLFSNLSSLSLIGIMNLRKNYKLLNYSMIDVNSHLYKIISYPAYLTLMTIFSAVIMLNIKYQKNSIFKVSLGIFFSVIIYYINYFFHALGTGEKLPLILSIILPLIILLIISIISIIKLNEK